MNKYYILIRKLHLYFGLFISPFVIIFCVGLLVLNHPGPANKTGANSALPEIRTKLSTVSYDGADIETAKTIIRELGLQGEIDFISRNKSSFSFPLNKPGLTSFIRVDTSTDSVFVSRKAEGALRAAAYLHIMPGPHNAKLRGNSFFMKFWRWFTDGLVYLLFFLTVSGVFLWYIVKAEIASGVLTLVLGILVFITSIIIIF